MSPTLHRVQRRPEPADDPTAGADGPCLSLYAEVLAADGPRAAAQSLVAQLAAAHSLSRVAIGLVERGGIVVQAVTGLDDPAPQGELVQALAGAMQEALEQGRTLCVPAVSPAPDALPDIRLEQQALHRLIGGCLATVPLGRDGEVLGAVVLQRDGTRTIDADEQQRIEHALALAAPALHAQVLAHEPLYRIAGRRFDAWRQRLNEPAQRRTRQWVWGGALVLLALALVPLPHEVGGRARLEGAQQRVLAAPTDGHVKAALVRPGDRVRAGAVLVELMDHDLALQRERWASQQAQHESAYAAAMARADRTQAAISQARLDEAQAQVALVDEQLGRSRITAPFDGLVIQGDLTQSIGAPVRQGDALVTLAAGGAPRVIVEVDEVDIARVQVGQAGRLRVSALPWDSRAIEVERIAPNAQPVDGRNVFEVQARMVDGADELRPGLQGRARIDVGWMPPLWAWARPWIDRLRLALWSFGA